MGGIVNHAPDCDLVLQPNAGPLRGWVCTCRGNHLPECDWSKPCEPIVGGGPFGHHYAGTIGGETPDPPYCSNCAKWCICDRLAKAEQRGASVYEAEIVAYGEKCAADEREKISQEIADGALRKVFEGTVDRGYRKATDEWTAIGIEQWNIAWAAGELKARITARKGFEDACELLGREELTLSEILTVLNGGTVPDPLFHDYDGHNSCTRCGQKAYNSGAEGPCPNHPNRNK